MRRFLLIVIAILCAVILYFLIARRSTPPEVPFTRVTRETVVSVLSTNGRVEPIHWASARAEVSGLVERILIRKGDTVGSGATLVELDSKQAQADLAAAQARIEQAQAEIQTLKAGGRSADTAAIAAEQASARQELEIAQREYDQLRRLQAKSAATGVEVTAAKDRVDRVHATMRALEQKRAALVNAPDLAAAEARVREAQATANAARQRISMAVIRSPIAGTVYQFDLKQGAYLNPGDLVASIGQLDRVRIIVYVDEPDLGRVAEGMPVNITWDAITGREWRGSVERVPTQVVALGTRQVGEVGCVIENPDHDLTPGANVTAEIRSKTVENAVTIPKGAIRRENGKTGVYILEGDRIHWRNVQLGTSSVTRTEVSGVKEGDSVALPSERPLKENMQVTPVWP